MVPRTRAADGLPGAVGPGLRQLRALAGGRRPGGGAGPGHLPVLGRVGQGRAGRGRVLGAGPRALPRDRRPLPRVGDHPDGHVQPLHLAALVRAARRVARPAGPGGLRALLQRRHRAPGRRHRLGRDAQRAEPSPAPELAGHPRRGARRSSARRCWPRASRPACLATGSATSCSRRRWRPWPTGMAAGHRAAKDAIKARRPELPVGFSVAIVDDQVVGDDASVRDRKRAEVYGRWLSAGARRRLRGRAELRARPVRRRRTRAPPPGATREPDGLARLPAVAGGSGPLRARGDRRPRVRDRARAGAHRRRLPGGVPFPGAGRAARRDRGRRAGRSATCTGRCWTTSSGSSATTSGSGCTRWTGRRSPAGPSRARPCTPRSRAPTRSAGR